ncbi:hypothetical protein L3X38_010295 [Prunus dulcis]|uniref:Uncharacterized protein n=1 Tax=Prunus dulcis TaxID=3755 RepID=A0AAD4WFA4_PRUDU|nr:hypothetical protein L3X38_010295 [Prunus dulcis]
MCNGLYSDQFTTYENIKCRDVLIRWSRAQGKMNNIVIVIRRFDSRGQGKRLRRPREYLLVRGAVNMNLASLVRQIV